MPLLAADLVSSRRLEERLKTLPAVARFVAKLPYTTLAANDFRNGAYKVHRDVAVHCREIMPDPAAWVTSIKLDVDCPCPGKPHVKAGYCHAAATAWLDAELPPPNIVTVNRRNGHAHIVYQLTSWVSRDRIKAVRYLSAIRRAYTAALGADPSYPGAFIHNPMHQDFDVASPRSDTYTLDELAQYVDLQLPYEPPAERVEGAPGRNCAAFDAVRKWGYRVVGGFKREGTEEDFWRVIRERVAAVNMTFSIPMHDAEVATIAKSIASWTWHVFRSADPHAAERRRARSRLRAAARKAQRAAQGRSRDLLTEAIAERRRLVLGHWKHQLTPTEIAGRVRASVRTVQRILASLATVAKPATRVDAASGDGGIPGASAGAACAPNWVTLRSAYAVKPPVLAVRPSPALHIVELAASRIQSAVARAAFLSAHAAFTGG